MTLSLLATRRSPWLALAGSLLVVLGLLTRVYHAGVDQTAVALVDAQGLEAATRIMSETYVDISYGPWLVPPMCWRASRRPHRQLNFVTS